MAVLIENWDSKLHWRAWNLYLCWNMTVTQFLYTLPNMETNPNTRYADRRGAISIITKIDTAYHQRCSFLLNFIFFIDDEENMLGCWRLSISNERMITLTLFACFFVLLFFSFPFFLFLFFSFSFPFLSFLFFWVNVYSSSSHSLGTTSFP